MAWLTGCRLNRSLVYFEAYIIAALRLAREKEINARVAPSSSVSVAIKERRFYYAQLKNQSMLLGQSYKLYAKSLRIA
jgi:hypothetical protein